MLGYFVLYMVSLPIILFTHDYVAIFNIMPCSLLGDRGGREEWHTVLCTFDRFGG